MSKPVFSDLFVFEGRRNRLSYFLYALAILVVMLLVIIIAAALDGQSWQAGGQMGPASMVALVISIVVGVSSWIVGAQRCRDFGWTGWAILLTLVPFVGWIFALAIFFIPGTPGDNRYGPNPLQ